MKILITGGAGYICSTLVPKLLDWKNEDGSAKVEQITVVDCLRFNQNPLAECFKDSRFRFICGDVQNRTLMAPLYVTHDVILPTAGLVGMPICNEFPQLAWALNHGVIQDMVSDLLKLNTEAKIVYFCTNSGYGSYPDGRFVTEQDELKPISVYGQSKVKAEQVVLEQRSGTSLRLATVMGISPFMRVGLLVNTFCWQAAKQKNIVLYEAGFKRNYINVDDVAQATMFAIEHYDEMKGEAYNLGLSSANLNKRELANKIAEQTELHILEAPLLKDEDKRDYLVSNAKIEALGFKPRWTLEATIASLLRFYKGITPHSDNVYFGTT